MTCDATRRQRAHLQQLRGESVLGEPSPQKRLHAGRALPGLADTSRWSQPQQGQGPVPASRPGLEPPSQPPFLPSARLPKRLRAPQDPRGGLTRGPARHRCTSPALGVGHPGQNLRRVFPPPPPNLKSHRPSPTVPPTRELPPSQPCLRP